MKKSPRLYLIPLFIFIVGGVSANSLGQGFPKPGQTAADKKKAEEQQKADEAKKAEDAKKAEEAKKLADVAKAVEAKKLADAAKAAEARKAEDARRAEQAKRVEEARKKEGEAKHTPPAQNQFQQSRESVRKMSEEGLRKQHLEQQHSKRIEEIQHSTTIKPEDKPALMRFVKAEGLTNSHGMPAGYSEEYASDAFHLATKLQGFNFGGPAALWLGTSSAAGWATSRNAVDAAVGSLLIWSGQGRGHAAIVTAVGATTLTVQEMNFGRMVDSKTGVTDHFEQSSSAVLQKAALNRGSYHFEGVILPRRK